MGAFDVLDRPAGRADGRGVNGESGWRRVWECPSYSVKIVMEIRVEGW